MKQLRVNNYALIPEKDSNTCKNLAQEIYSEYHNLVGSNQWDTAANTVEACDIKMTVCLFVFFIDSVIFLREGICV